MAFREIVCTRPSCHICVHCLKSNVTELRSHQVSWRIQPRNARKPGQGRRGDPPQRLGGLDLPVRRAGVRPLLIPAVVRQMGHYVNHSVRGFLPPARWRFSPPRFGPSRLRMRRIIRPRVVAPAIQSAPVATHSVATIAHLAFSLAVTILIPDCAPPKRLSTAFFPQPPPAPIYGSGRSRT